MVSPMTIGRGRLPVSKTILKAFDIRLLASGPSKRK